jgi:hypothetical protein
MIVTKKDIQYLRKKSFLNISKEMEEMILERFDKEMEPDEDGCIYEYTQQDIWEQIRKMLRNK